jgi:predicted MPP superfamily phosphohydrolase
MQEAHRRDAVRPFPSDRAYGRLHWALMGIIAAIVLYGLVIASFLDTPRVSGIRLLAGVMMSFSVLWCTIADRRFARHVRSETGSRILRLGALIFCAALNAPIFYMLWAARPPSFIGSPTWYAAAVTLWQISLALLMPIVALLRLAGLGTVYVVRRARFRWRPEAQGSRSVGLPDCPADHGAQAFDPARRAMLKTAVATVPMVALAGLTGAARSQESELQVNRHSLPAPWLPDRLRGLTITHISDLHVGRLYRPWMLPRLVETANALRGDIVVVTGDIIDNSNDLLPPAVEAVSRLTHRYGLFLCIGNHDQIDSRPDFIRYCRPRLPLLINERRCIEIGGERITIAGLDFAWGEQPSGRHGGFIADVADTLAGHDPRTDGPVIALAHHPHEWDALAEAGVPLTLSGHTHGGQIMFTAPGQRPDQGIGRLLFRYLRGFYADGHSTLFVNSGVGNWFPLRINAPAEIVQIRLV